MTCSEGVQGEPPFAFAKAMSPKSAKKRPGKLDEVRRARSPDGLDARRAAQAIRDACRSGNQDRVLVAHRVCSAGFGRVSCRLAPRLIWKRFPRFQEVMRCRPVTCLLGIMWIRESPDCVMEPAASVTQGGRRTGATAAPGTLAATRRECVMPVGLLSGAPDAKPIASGRADHAGTFGKRPRVLTLSTRRKWPGGHAGALPATSPSASDEDRRQAPSWRRTGRNVLGRAMHRGRLAMKLPVSTAYKWELYTLQNNQNIARTNSLCSC